MTTYGPPPGPHTTPEQVLAAVAALEIRGAPVRMGGIGWHVAPAIGVDTSMVTTTYDLRGHMSWTILRRNLDSLVRDGLLARMDEVRWRAASGGHLFNTGRPRAGTWAYATRAMAARFVSEPFWAQGGLQAAREEAAHQWAVDTLVGRYAQEYQVLREQWAGAHPAAPSETEAAS